MKKWIVMLLALTLVMGLAGCAKEPTLAAVIKDYPIEAASVNECTKFLKSNGFKVESAEGETIIFDGGNWDGFASTGFPRSVSLNCNTFAVGSEYEAFVESAIREIKGVCGEPYSSRTDSQLGMTTEFYSYDNKVIHVAIITSGMKSLSITVMQAP